MKIGVLMVLILVLGAPLAYRDPYVTIPEEVEVRTGETAHIELIVEHVQTTMWNLKVYVDTNQIESTFLNRIDVVQDQENPIIFEEEIPPGTKVPVTIDIEVAETSPAGEVRIPVIVAGSKGPCMKGCEPFLIQKSTLLIIKRQDPRMALLLPQATFDVYAGETLSIEVQLRNYSATSAYIESVEATPDKPLTILNPSIPNSVAPGNTASIVITIITTDASPGTYLVQVKLVYRDQIQNKFTDSKTIYITIQEKTNPLPSSSPPATVNPTPQPSTTPLQEEEKYLYFLMGMVTGAGIFAVAVMVGIFLKKRRPTQ